MALSTVADYISQARVLLQDTVATYRYADSDLVDALNLAVRSAARIRPDLFFKLLRTGSLPTYSSASPSTAVSIDQRYQSSFLLFIVGMVQLRDDENTQDTRAAALTSKFVSELTVIQA